MKVSFINVINWVTFFGRLFLHDIRAHGTAARGSLRGLGNLANVTTRQTGSIGVKVTETNNNNNKNNNSVHIKWT